ncbi:ABC transporter, substrate-binding protein (cluster 3, basic aa/glutamine/opines) [Olavius sp. associated proteobacterium Delta 1]|nr:ABC transporter, substrate-binding protein (cluster 3, basic aa/glutamine/opines) [Olavius sp. associated proteobacterium Delta 1]
MKLQKSIRIVLALVFTISMAAVTYAGTLDEIAMRGELRVACQTQGPPFSFIDKNSERSGSSIEIVRLIAKEMGVKVKFLSYDWDGLIPALLSKKADMLAADMTPTLKRAMKIAFSEPFMYTGSVVFTKQDSPYKSLEDFKKPGLSIAVLLGSTGETDAKKTFPNAKLKSYKGGGPLLIDAVLKGHADFGVNDASAVTGQVSNFPPNSVRILPEMLSKLPLAFAVRYDSMDLLEWLNLFFLHIRLDGRMDQNLDYWVNSLDWKKDH